MRAHRRAWARWLVAAALVPSVAACGSSAADRADDAAPATRAQRTLPPVAPEQSAHFAILRTAPEGLPVAVGRILRLPIDGLRPDLAQQVPERLPGRFWLVPGREHLCVVARLPGTPGVGTICASTADALRHGVANTTLDRRSGARLVVGLAPDGVHAVRLHTGGSAVPVRVVNGRFAHRDAVAAPVDRITLGRAG